MILDLEKRRYEMKLEQLVVPEKNGSAQKMKQWEHVTETKELTERTAREGSNKKYTMSQAPLAHTCNPSYFGG
jgi:hypothetical protein